MSRRQRRRQRHDDSWHQSELQWLEDGIHILFEQILKLGLLFCLLVLLVGRTVWRLGLAMWRMGCSLRR